MRTHEAIDRRSLEMVRRIVARIDADPERRGLAHAKSVCERWVGQGIASAQEWLTILDQPWEEIRAVLLDDGDEGQRLRQTDPFCGILTPAERWQIYREAQGAMKREQFEHILRAAGAITGQNEWVIVGSQAILGAIAEPPAEITVSEELDLYAPSTTARPTWWPRWEAGEWKPDRNTAVAGL